MKFFPFHKDPYERIPASLPIAALQREVRKDPNGRILIVIQALDRASPFIRLDMSPEEARCICDDLNDILCMGGN